MGENARGKHLAAVGEGAMGAMKVGAEEEEGEAAGRLEGRKLRESREEGLEGAAAGGGLGEVGAKGRGLGLVIWGGALGAGPLTVETLGAESELTGGGLGAAGVGAMGVAGGVEESFDASPAGGDGADAPPTGLFCNRSRRSKT